MRLKNLFKTIFIFGLVLLLGFSGFTGAAPITVYADEQEIKLNVYSQTVVKGTSFSLYVYNLSDGQSIAYASSDPAVASVDEEGLVTANAVGTATIFATVTEAENTVVVLPCEIKVGPPAISVQFSRLELAMMVGQKLTLERIVQPLNTVETPKFSSFDRSIATVSAGGRITAKSEGSTYIFAQINNGRFAVCKVDVFAEALPTPAPSLTEEVVPETNGALVFPETDSHTENSSTEQTITKDAPTEEKSEESAAEKAVESDTETEDFTEASTDRNEEISDSDTDIMSDIEEIDFETFIKKLNKAAGKTTEAESNPDTTN